MRSRWDEREVAGLDELEVLVYASRLVGAEPSLVVWGGGNSSIKTWERDHRGRPVEVLRVKGSGADLKSVERRDFPGVRMDEIRALRDREDMGDREMVEYLSHALQEPRGRQPSIETLLHGFLEAYAVIHTHADAVVALTNHDRCHEVLGEVFGKDVVTLPYRRPGFRLSREVAEAVGSHPGARAVILEKHGTITWGATVREAYEATVELVSRAEAAIAARRSTRVRFGGPRVSIPEPGRRRQVALAVAPWLRGQLSRVRRQIVAFDDSPRVLEFVSSVEAPRISQVGPATPDHTLYTKRLPCFVELDDPTDAERVRAALAQSLETYEREYTRYFDTHRFEGAVLSDPLPRVVLVPGLGMFTAGRDHLAATIVRDIYHHTIEVLGDATSFGRYVSLSPREAFEVEYWPLELYKLTLAPPERELARRVALVTGGASGIGRAVARRLATEGAHVVIGDIDLPGARAVAEEIVARAGPGRALAVALDVTDEASVEAAVAETVLVYGGLDILVSNAGIAPSAPVVETSRADWERSFAVNATGHFLVARAAMRVLIRQGLGGALVFVATKNVMAPGRDLAAYSAAKAAEAQLAKVLALEGAAYGIRSNVVNPDAVFQDSRLWTPEVRRQRALAQGIPVEALEEFYRTRNLLGVSILPEDVAEAVLFFASDRSAKTTGCTLTVDGGVREAFPR